MKTASAPFFSVQSHLVRLLTVSIKSEPVYSQKVPDCPNMVYLFIYLFLHIICNVDEMVLTAFVFTHCKEKINCYCYK